jgi:hypothetical protein
MPQSIDHNEVLRLISDESGSWSRCCRTVRPSIGTDALLERMRARNLTSYLVTTPDGRLVGLVRRDELE